MVFGMRRTSGGQDVVVEEEAPMSNDRSTLRSFIASIATVTGDLSNITAPSSILAPKSTVEVPSYQGENPSLFCSGADSEDPAERAMLVLRSFLCGIRSQCYMGHDMSVGLKKPLNAFLGEIFISKWEDDCGTTSYVGEQVSHHPPITACRVWNDKHGVVFEAHNRSSITLSTSVTVSSTGHAIKTFTKHNEHYLIPIPDFKVKGLLSRPYPELTGTYYIPSTSGYISVIHFSEQGFFYNGTKHSFTAHVYFEPDGAEDQPLYTLKGQWHESFTIHDNLRDTEIEVLNIQRQVIDTCPPMTVTPLDQQDDWESRNAWRDVISSIEKGDMRGTTQAKSKLEQAQRQMRKDEATANTNFETLFFKPVGPNDIVERLAAMLPKDDARRHKVEAEKGWRLDVQRYEALKRPYRELRPDGTKTVLEKQEANSYLALQ